MRNKIENIIKKERAAIAAQDWGAFPVADDLEVTKSLSGDGQAWNHYTEDCTYNEAAEMLGGVENLQAFLEGSETRREISVQPIDWTEGTEMITLWKK